MLCRRCGMDSSTTDVCEWCNRPMLPAGATVSGKAAKELKESGTPITVPHQPDPNDEVGLPLSQRQPEEESVEIEETEASENSTEAHDVVLRPLGGMGASAPTAPPAAPAPPPVTKPNVPSHGLSDDATKTSIDISQYMGSDASIFRPIVRESEQSSSSGTVDRLAYRSKSSSRNEPVNEIPENTRLMKSFVAGVVITIVAAIVQAIAGEGAKQLEFVGMTITLSRSGGIIGAILWGIVAGALFGLMLGAALVRLKKGPFLGAIVGFLVGISLNNPPYAQIAGALTGIVAGRFATIGLRRIVNV